MVMEVVHEDIGEGNMQCTNHPYKNSTPGGICAFCLQEKLGKLVSSSFPVAVFPSSSSSPSPSFRSEISGTGAALPLRPIASSSSRLPFVLTHKKKKKKDGVMMNGSDSAISTVFKRSKSTHFLEEDYSPHRKGFWSFLYQSKHATAKKSDTPSTVRSSSVTGVSGPARSRDKKREDFVVVDENGSPDESSFDRKVSRSKSVGCGSRSFSGEFFERISTGFGDCTLRRVESQREGKTKVPSVGRNGMNHNGQQDCIKERVKCGGIFRGFMVISSSSEDNVNGKSMYSSHSSSSVGHHLSHGRSKSWGWPAFASPMRAFSSKPSSSSGKKHASSRKNATTNLGAVPSLLAVSG